MSDDLFLLCSTLEMGLGARLNQWQAARALSHRRGGELSAKLEQAHCEGVVLLLREYLEELEGQGNG